MQIRMIVDTRVAADGVTVETWAAGETREVDEQLGGDLIAAKKAEKAPQTRRQPQSKEDAA